MVDLFSDIRSDNQLYCDLRDSDDPFFIERREYVTQLWERFKPYADKWFVSAFSKHVVERYWEMAIGCFLLDCGLNLSETWAKESKGKGLDFLVNLKNGKRLWVECVTCSGGDWDNPNVQQENLIPPIKYYTESLTKSDPDIDDSSFLCGCHLEQLKLRVAGSFRSKMEHIIKSIKDETIECSKNDYFVIAIGGGRIQPRVWHDNLFNDLDYYSLLGSVTDCNMINLGNGAGIYKREEQVSKHAFNGMASIGKPFEMEDSILISEVLFSTQTIASNSFQWLNDIYSIRNINSENKLPENTFGMAENINVRFEGKTLYIDK